MNSRLSDYLGDPVRANAIRAEVKTMIGLRFVFNDIYKQCRDCEESCKIAKAPDASLICFKGGVPRTSNRISGRDNENRGRLAPTDSNKEERNEKRRV